MRRMGWDSMSYVMQSIPIVLITNVGRVQGHFYVAYVHKYTAI